MVQVAKQQAGQVAGVHVPRDLIDGLLTCVLGRLKLLGRGFRSRADGDDITSKVRADFAEETAVDFGQCQIEATLAARPSSVNYTVANMRP